jgi:hypothetical protein
MFMRYVVLILCLVLSQAEAQFVINGSGTRNRIDGNGITITPPTPTFNFSVNSTDSPRVISGDVTTTSTVGNKVLQTTTSAMTRHDQLVTLAVTNPDGLAFTPSYVSSNTAVATWDGANSKLVHNGDGNVNLTVTAGSITHVQPYTLTTTGGNQTVISAWLIPSIGSDSFSYVQALQASSTSTAVAMFSDISGSSYIRNSSIWTGTLNLTGISPWNSFGWGGEGGVQRAGVLVAPDIIICANHFYLPDGTQIIFVTQNGITYSRIITAGAQIAGSDIYLAKLDSALPSEIKAYKIAPLNFISYASDGRMYPLPMIAKNQTLQIHEQELVSMYESGTNVVGPYYSSSWKPQPTYPASQPFGYTAYSGDSGSPLFLVLNGELVLHSVYTGVGNGATIYQYVSAINAQIDAWGGAYHLTTVDLSNYPTY